MNKISATIQKWDVSGVTSIHEMFSAGATPHDDYSNYRWWHEQDVSHTIQKWDVSGDTSIIHDMFSAGATPQNTFTPK